jgi:hypothetical protein
MIWADDEVYGFFAFLDYDTRKGRTSLQLVFNVVTDDGGALVDEIEIPLGDWTIKDANRMTSDEMDDDIESREAIAKYAATLDLPKIELPDFESLHKDPDHIKRMFGGKIPDKQLKEILENGISEAAWDELFQDACDQECADNQAPFMSLLLYLCADEPEISTHVLGEYPKLPKAKRVKREWVLEPPSAPKIWHVGQETGEALRVAREQSNAASDGAASRKAHIRRAHWHGYWSGPVKPPEGVDATEYKRRFGYKWLHPMLVSGFKKEPDGGQD